MDSLEDLISHHPFTTALDRAQVQFLASCATVVIFKPGQSIFAEGESANDFYLIAAGKAQVQIHPPEEGEILIDQLGDGDVLGWSWFFPPYYWHFDATALECVTAVRIYGKRLREHCEDDPAFGYEVIKRITQLVIQRLQKTRLHLLEASRSGR